MPDLLTLCRWSKSQKLASLVRQDCPEKTPANKCRGCECRRLAFVPLAIKRGGVTVRQCVHVPQKEEKTNE